MQVHLKSLESRHPNCDPAAKALERTFKNIYLAVYMAKRARILVAQPCEKCVQYPEPRDGTRQVVAHHNDYNSPLNVRWLCNRHHLDWHLANEPTMPTEAVIGRNAYYLLRLGISHLIENQEMAKHIKALGYEVQVQSSHPATL